MSFKTIVKFLSEAEGMFPPGLQHNSGGVTKELLVKKAKLLNIDFPEESTKKSILDLIKIHLDKVASVAMPSGAILSAAIRR